MDSQDIIDRAYLILSSNDICRGTYASSNGVPCFTEDPAADAFCSVGACARAAQDLGVSLKDPVYPEAIQRLQKMVNARAVEDLLISSWNDMYATDDQIRELFAKAASPTVTSALAVA